MGCASDLKYPRRLGLSAKASKYDLHICGYDKNWFFYIQAAAGFGHLMVLCAVNVLL
jgi:hypothetical protein